MIRDLSKMYPQTRHPVSAAGGALARRARGDSPRRPLRAELCLGPEGQGGRPAPRGPFGEPPAVTPLPTPRRGGTLGGGAERQLSCSHFLIVVFEAPGSRTERFAVPATPPGEGGARAMEEARLRGGAGRAPSAAARLVRLAARECGAPAPRAAGPGDARASPPAGCGGWRPRPPPPPDLTAARRHGASPPDGPVSIPGGEGVGAARRPPGVLGGRGSGAGSRTRRVWGGPADAGARGHPELASAGLCGEAGVWGGR